MQRETIQGIIITIVSFDKIEKRLDKIENKLDKLLK